MPVNRKVVGGFLAAVIAAAAAFTQPWEGTVYEGYSDVVGVMTACTGHTGPEVVLGKVYDKYQCDLWFKRDLQVAAGYVLQCIQVPLTVNQAASLTSAVFNLGPGVVCDSTLQRLANSGYPPSAWCPQLRRWNRAGGKVINGLTRRREAETQLCLGK